MSEQAETPTILVVDDHAPAAAMVSQIFNMRGYNAVTVDNGIDAIKMAQSLMPDVILLDVMMPGMDGYEVMEELRKIKVTADIPIIMVTTFKNPASPLKTSSLNLETVKLPSSFREAFLALKDTIITNN